MKGCVEHIDRANRMGFCIEDVALVGELYQRGYEDGATAHQSCSPPVILSSNLIRRYLVEGLPEHWKTGEVGCGGKVVELMALAYYDGFNKRVTKKGILSSEYFD